ncbi:Nicotinamidase-related amidase [Paenibacillus sp. CF095]|uniref:cysteine hydrolase family protein n=1 Tax=Paenibacillus TaxID=44249 RepID=UPI0008810626|nr:MULTISPECIES: cysteine hydrolase family protein [Paenibacillus]MCP1422532.1 nicotinamidase-related amidase [Paenibacillus xylanexedens]SDC24093.1 Nicotinamidase-related amidase [Paenibacillus sp. CF095]
MTTHCALLIIDVQVAMFDEADPVYQGEQLLQKIQMLMAKAREAGHFIIYIQHSEGAGSPLERGTSGWAIHPSIAPISGDLVIEKETPDSFHETNLHLKLQEDGVTELILAGMQTEVCVDTTCRRAYSLGYTVNLVQDAHSTWNSKTLQAEQIIEHHNTVLRLFANVVDTENAL